MRCQRTLAPATTQTPSVVGFGCGGHGIHEKARRIGIDTVNKRVAPARYWDQRGMAMRGPYVPASPATENPLPPEVTAHHGGPRRSVGSSMSAGGRGRIIPLKELFAQI